MVIPGRDLGWTEVNTLAIINQTVNQAESTLEMILGHLTHLIHETFPGHQNERKLDCRPVYQRQPWNENHVESIVITVLLIVIIDDRPEIYAQLQLFT